MNRFVACSECFAVVLNKESHRSSHKNWHHVMHRLICFASADDVTMAEANEMALAAMKLSPINFNQI